MAANTSKYLKGNKNGHEPLYTGPDDGQTNNTTGGGLSLSNFMNGFGKPKVEPAQPDSGRTGSIASVGELAPPVAMTYPSYSETGSSQESPGKAAKYKDQAMVDRDESQLTDPEGLAPLEEDTQR